MLTRTSGHPLLSLSRLPAVLAVILLSPCGSPAWGQLRVELSPSEAHPLTPVEVTAITDARTPPERVELRYRALGAGAFETIPMAAAGSGRYRALIPAATVVPPGVAFVVQVSDRAGHVVTDPPDASSDRAHVVVVSAPAQPATPPPIATFTPEPNGVVVGRRPTLKVMLTPDAPPLRPGQVMVTIDGADMTTQLEIIEREIRLRPASALRPGAHQAVLTFLDPAGQPLPPVSWPFTVKDYPALEEGSLTTGFSGTYQDARDRLNRTDPAWKADANLRVDGRLADDSFEGTFNANFRYRDQGRRIPGLERNIDLANDLFTVKNTQGAVKGRLEQGDVGISESALTTGVGVMAAGTAAPGTTKPTGGAAPPTQAPPSAGGFARRGVKFTGEAPGTDLHLFAVSAQPLLGFDNFSGLDFASRRVQGGSLSHTLVGDDALRLKVTLVNGQSTSSTAYNIGSSGGGTDGTTYSVLATSKLFDGRLNGEAEWARSQILKLTSADLGEHPDELGRKPDEAWRVALEGSISRVQLRGEYQRVGRDFASLANPTLVQDREGETGTAQTAFGPTTWQLLLSRSNDNVLNDRKLPRTFEWKVAPTFGLVIPNYPFLTLSYMRSTQETEHAPDGVAPMDSLLQNYTATLAYSRPTWSASLSPSYSTQSFDRHGVLSAGSDTDMRGVSLTLGFTPTSWFNASPSYTFNRTGDLSTHTVTDTHVPTLTARLVLWPDVLTVDTQGSYTATTDNKATVDTGVISTLLRVSWSLKRWSPADVAPALSVRLNYARTADGIAPTNNREDFGVFLIFDVFAPLPLLPPPGLDLFQSSPGRTGPPVGPPRAGL